MLMTFGILSLMTGVLLLAIALLRLPFIRNSHTPMSSFTIKVLCVSMVLIITAVLMISHAQDRESINGMTFGIIIFFVGMVIAGLGIWISFWGPLSLRNTNKGLQFIIIGLILLITAIFAMSISKINIPNGETIRDYNSTSNWEYIFSRRMGPISFGTFALVLLIFTNGLALRCNLRFNKIIGVNLVLLALLILAYAIGPKFFYCW
jgi:hypothetical protein